MGASPFAGTTPARTGPIGRAVRLLLAALLAVFALDLIDAGVTDYDGTEVLRFPGFWLLTVATIDTLIRFLPLPRRLRWLAPAALAAVAITAAAISVASTGSAWGPPLTRLVWSLHVALLVMASVSLIPAVALATPSCELTVWRDLRARARGTNHPPAVQPCVAGLHLLDAWEARHRIPDVHNRGDTMTNRQPPTSSPTAEARATRAMLNAGVVAGPFFVLVSLAQAFTRDGFDLRRHAFSMLSLGDLGWLQIVNFVLAGTLFVVAGLGARRALSGRRAGAILLMIFGVSQIAGGVFVVDPSLGFPVGTADRVPEQLSWHGTLHTVAFAIGIGTLVAACAVWSRTFRSLGLRRWSGYSAATAAAFVLLAAIGVTSADFRIVTVAIVIGWGWASLVCARLRDPGSPLPTSPAQSGTSAMKEETQL